MTEADVIQRIRDLTVGVNAKHFQQWPEELGAMAYVLLQRPHADWNYLEIGAGAGHVARVLDDLFSFDAIRLIDDDKLYGGRLEQVPNAIEWVGDSTSREAHNVLHRWGLTYNLIFVDASHEYHSVKVDVQRALRYAADPCYVCLHDTEKNGVPQCLWEVIRREDTTMIGHWVHKAGNRGTALIECRGRI